MLPTIFYQELFGNHCSDDCFAKTHNVCQEETIVANQFLISFDDCIKLIVIFRITLWHIKRICVVSSQDSA